MSAFQSRRVIIIGAVGLIVLLSMTWLLSQPRRVPPDRTSPTEPVIAESDGAPSTANPGYLGMMVCKECHPQRVTEFSLTRHFLANRIPDSSNMPQGFDEEKGRFLVPELSLNFRMSKSDDAFLETAIVDTQRGKQATASQIAFCYGSEGGNDEVYFTWHGDRLYELPIAWLEPNRTWGASLFDRHGHGDFSREMTVRCVECHNTWFDYETGSRNRYRKDTHLSGVTCEVCHGPGREHVAFHREHPNDIEPHAVARPALFSRDRLMDLCAQCHSNAIKHKSQAFGYRPGKPLDDFYYTLKTKYPEEDHVANQTTYLRQSRCFQESTTLTCVTCHNPHQSRSTANAGSASCAKCHTSDNCHERDRIPEAVQNNCIGCHMPERRKVQVFFRTEQDNYVAPVNRYEHRIGVYADATKEVLFNWYRSQSDDSRQIAATLSTSLAASYRLDAYRFRSEFRFLAAIDALRQSLKFENDPTSVDQLRDAIDKLSGIDRDLQDGMWHEREHRYGQAIDSFKRILTANPLHAAAHAKLGTTYAIVGKKILAVEHLKRSFECDPNDPYAPAMLGWLAYLDGRADESLVDYHQAEEVEPYSAKINHQLGMSLAHLGRSSEAIERFRKSIEINPNDAKVLIELAQLLQRTDQSDEALKHAVKAAELTEFQDAEIDLALAEILATRGQLDDAVAAARRATAAASRHQPRLISKAQHRLRDLESQLKSRRSK